MKEVLIAVKGMQEAEGASNGDELVTPGVYSYEDGVCRFSYMESELTGMEGTKTTFEIYKSYVTLTREGTVSSQMVFETGRKHVFVYDTPFGAMTMGVSTSSISAKMSENGGDLEIHCTIDMENSLVSRNVFKINVREAQSERA